MENKLNNEMIFTEGEVENLKKYFEVFGEFNTGKVYMKNLIHAFK